MAREERTYTEPEIEARLQADLPEWHYADGWLRRDYRTDGWPTTLMLVNQIGFMSEAAFHHPDLNVTWDRVGVRLQTHSAGGITDKDLELARMFDETVLWRPPAGSALEGTPNEFVRGGKPES